MAQRFRIETSRRPLWMATCDLGGARIWIRLITGQQKSEGRFEGPEIGGNAEARETSTDFHGSCYVQPFGGTSALHAYHAHQPGNVRPKVCRFFRGPILDGKLKPKGNHWLQMDFKGNHTFSVVYLRSPNLAVPSGARS